jgi:hypothetical protein
MTGHFASYQGPHSRLAKLPPAPPWLVPGCRHRRQHPHADRSTMHDQDDTGLLTQFGRVAILAGDTSRPTPNL